MRCVVRVCVVCIIHGTWYVVCICNVHLCGVCDVCMVYMPCAYGVVCVVCICVCVACVR